MKKSLYILAELNDRDFDWLIRAGRKRSISAGTILIREEEAIDALYIVLEGTFTVSAEATQGAVIAELSAGEVVGEMSFVDARPPSATVTAQDHCVVWAIPRSQLAAKLGQDVGFASRFYRALAVLLSDRLRGTISRLGYSKYRPLNEGRDSEVNLNPEILGGLELAKVRLDWLLNKLKDM
jgi:bacteriocin-type transport-associated protein